MSIYDGVITKPPLEEVLEHSGVKGMTWEKHKYIKRANGTYYYPNGNNTESTDKDSKKKNNQNVSLEPKDIENLSEQDVDNLAREVIRGNFKNGQERKEFLGEHYQKVQDRVNQILKGNNKLNTKKSIEKTSTTKSETNVKKELDYEVKNGNNHYKYRVKKK